MDKNEFTGILQKRNRLLQAIRTFFFSNSFIEVETPMLMKTAPPDPHIEPLTAFVGKEGPFYLHTSPEMGMKRILSYGTGRIFEITKTFRTEEFTEVHNTEFTMLEWYMEGDYGDAMEMTTDLIRSLVAPVGAVEAGRFEGPWMRCNLGNLVMEKTGIDPFLHDRDSLARVMTKKGFSGIDRRDDWSNLFFKLFIQDVEPLIHIDRPYFITDWPASISTMAKKKDTKRVERFELYIDGLEIANGYTELTDADEQQRRFEADNATRKALGRPQFAIDEEFLAALDSLTGSYTGVSIGVDRLLMALLRKKTINEVLPLRNVIISPSVNQ